MSENFVGPRAAMITPWSTNAVEITQNMGISGIIRIEEFQKIAADFQDFDPMLFQKYTELFHSYLDNKTVALVGPAESIYGTNKGHVIDKFDIVVRLNKSVPLPENLQADIGTKTDILYNSLNFLDDQERSINFTLASLIVVL